MSQPPRTRSEVDRELASALDLVQQLQPALEQRDRAKQNAIIGQLIGMRAPMGDQWRALANFVAQNGEMTLARHAIDLFVEARGGHPQALYMKAAMLEQMGALRDAYDVMSSLPPNIPDPAANAFSLGTAALFLGETREAHEKLELATRLQPQSGAAWLSLAMSANLAEAPEIAERIVDAETDMENAAPQDRAPFLYALGKAKAELRDYARAFRAFESGASLMKTMVGYDRDADRHDAEESLRQFSKERIAALAKQQSEPTDSTIFVTGSPRTGTTLVEQILTSHSAVSDGAEIHRLPILAHEVRGHGIEALESFASQRGVAGLAKLWKHLIAERFPGRGRMVDKSLSTTRLIGLAASVLPDAPLIWMTRDPLDCAWSCYRTFFPASMQWTYDQRDIAFHFALEAELLQRWQEILGERLLVVPYESLIGAPEEWIRRILAHCGLEEEARIFQPQDTVRTVTTASVTQVRKPINRDGIRAAGPYREYLGPFLEAMQDAQA